MMGGKKAISRIRALKLFKLLDPFIDILFTLFYRIFNVIFK